VEAAFAAEPNLGQYFDVMATHPYTGSVAGYVGAAPPESITMRSDGRMDKMSFPAYRELRATMAAHGGAKPIWFTEFGWATETGDGWGVSQAQQADYLTRALRYVEQDPYVEVACWYNLRNNYWAGNANNWEDNLGLMKTDFSHKPAYDTFKSYTPGAGPAPTPDPTPAPTPAPAPTTSPTTTSSPTTSTRPKKKTRTSLRVGTAATSSANTPAVSSHARSYSLGGKVVASTGGFVTIRFQRAAGSSRAFRTVRLVRVRLAQAGTFGTRVRLRGRGMWRVQAAFDGNSTDLPSASRFAYLRP
jgi:Glycosyl hydrolase catalytic core